MADVKPKFVADEDEDEDEEKKQNSMQRGLESEDESYVRRKVYEIGLQHHTIHFHCVTKGTSQVDPLQKQLKDCQTGHDFQIA